MNDPKFAGVGGPASFAKMTWGGVGPRRICDADRKPFPFGTYEATVSEGMLLATDAKFNTLQWVYPGEMVEWDGVEDPTLKALQKAKDAITEVGRLLGLGV